MAVEASMLGPRFDVDYAVELGNSFRGRDSTAQPFCSLRYDFQPASVSRAKPGVLQQNGNNKVSLYLSNNNNGDLDVHFSGKFEAAKDDLDVIAIFDGTSFRLEQMSGQIKTRYVRDSAPYGGASSQNQQVSPSSVDDLFPSDDEDPPAALGTSPQAQHAKQQQQSGRPQPKRASPSPPLRQDTSPATRPTKVQATARQQAERQQPAGAGTFPPMGRGSSGQREVGAPAAGKRDAASARQQGIPSPEAAGRSPSVPRGMPAALHGNQQLYTSASPEEDEGEDEELGAALDAEWEDEEEEEEDGASPPVQASQQLAAVASRGISGSQQQQQQQQQLQQHVAPPAQPSQTQPAARPQQQQQQEPATRGSATRPPATQAAAPAAHKASPPPVPKPAKPSKSPAFDAMNPLEAAWATNMDEEEEEEEEEQQQQQRQQAPQAVQQPAAAPPTAAAAAQYEEEEEGDEDDDDGDANRCSDDDSDGGIEYF